jgi:hypothetical protein
MAQRRNQSKKSSRSRQATRPRQPRAQPTNPRSPEGASKQLEPSHTDPIPSGDLETLKERPEFWDGVLRVAGTEPRAAKDLGGASGVRHDALAIGVDDVEKRIIVISAEGEAYGAALAQADIQSATPDYKVIVVRPLIVSVENIASAITGATGTPRISMKSLGLPSELSEEQMRSLFDRYLSDAAEVIDRSIHNARSVTSPSIPQIIKQVIDQLTAIRFESDDEDLTIDLTGVTGRSAASLDSRLGICGFPLSEMSEADLDAFLDRQNLDGAREVLRRLGVYQFFFPPPDQLLLGTIDRNASISDSEQPTDIAQHLGHPAGRMELVPADTPLTELIDALKDRKLLVEGEVSVELTEEGISQRASVRFTPREGIVSKIINRISVSLDLRQIVGLQVGGRPQQDTRSDSTPG